VQEGIDVGPIISDDWGNVKSLGFGSFGEVLLALFRGLIYKKS
jgi:hypothetical protein